jgi:hypothetical protein
VRNKIVDILGTIVTGQRQESYAAGAGEMLTDAPDPLDIARSWHEL